MHRQEKTLGQMLMLIVILGVVAIVSQPFNSKGQTTISMLNVGQGDSFLIQAANGAQLLIDGGRDAKVLTELARVMPRGDQTIDVVIATHPDADHIGGLPLVFDRYNVGLFLTSDVQTDTKTFDTLFATLQAHKVPSYYVRRGMKLMLDESTTTHFSVLFPDRDTKGWETNTASIVGRLDSGIGTDHTSALFTGDSPISIENYLVTKHQRDIDVDILKLGHHGSKTSSSEAYLRATSPILALISAGVNNSYGHPHTLVTDSLTALGIPMISTQDRGTVTIGAKGNTWVLLK